MTLTPQQIEQYRRDGYRAFDELLRGDEVKALLSCLEDLALERVPRPAGVRMQIEPAVRRGDAVADSPLLALRKVEGLVEHVDTFAKLAADPRILDVMQ